MKVLIYIKNNDSKCFLWFLIKHLNPLKIHSERNAKANKNMVNDLDYKTVKFSVSRKDFSIIEKKNNISINTFCCKVGLVQPVHWIKILKTVWIYY